MLGRLADLGRFRPIFSSLDVSRQIIDVHWMILGVDRRNQRRESNWLTGWSIKGLAQVCRLGLSCSSKSSEAFRCNECKRTDQDRFQLVIDQIVGKAFDVSSGLSPYPKIYVLTKNFGRLPAIVYRWAVTACLDRCQRSQTGTS